MKAKISLGIRLIIAFTIFIIVTTPTLLIPRKLLYRVYKLFTTLYLTASKVKVINLTKETFEINPPAIYASNHKAYTDFTSIAHFLTKPFTVMLKAEMTDNIFFRIIAWKMGLIPVNRANYVSHIRALDKSIIMLRKKYSLIIFPEGWYSFDKPVGELKSGIIKIARETNAPVVPIALYGVHNTFIDEDKLHWKKAYMKAGKPILFNDYPDGKEFLNDLKNKIEKLYIEIEDEIKNKV